MSASRILAAGNIPGFRHQHGGMCSPQSAGIGAARPQGVCPLVPVIQHCVPFRAALGLHLPSAYGQSNTKSTHRCMRKTLKVLFRAYRGGA
jgi:hypothetical protein